MPNIMKIRQCFLELQLKMSGMFFFETHCRSSYGRNVFNVASNNNTLIFYQMLLLPNQFHKPAWRRRFPQPVKVTYARAAYIHGGLKMRTEREQQFLGSNRSIFRCEILCTISGKRCLRLAYRFNKIATKKTEYKVSCTPYVYDIYNK